MKTKLLAAGITLGVAVAAFMLSPVIWPHPTDPTAPTLPTGLLPFLLVAGILEALAFGLGVAFLIFGGRLLARAGQPTALTYVTYVAIAWSLVSWWPHDNFHQSIGNNFGALVAVIYAFHLSLVVTGAVIAYFFLRVLASSTRLAIQQESGRAQPDMAGQFQAAER